jgi:vacuolar protein sorting-associated protein 45
VTSATTSANTSDRPSEVIVFIIGGVTYEEATKVAELNAALPHATVVLGGTCIHNSTSFLDELALSTRAPPTAAAATAGGGVQPFEIGYR